MEQHVGEAQALIAGYGVRVVAAIAIFVAGRWLAAVVARAVGRALERAGSDDTIRRFAVDVVRIAGVAFVVLAVLGHLGIQTASLIAVIGAAGLAVGFALQGSLANLAAGVMLVVFRPFKVGDFVEVAGASGTVKEIALFTTRLCTPDNVVVLVPNGRITADNIVNASANDTRRVDLVFAVGYDDDLPTVMTLLRQMLAADARVLPDPEPVIGVVELGDSSVRVAVRPWVRTADYWGLYFDLHQTVKQRFEEAGISIPYPRSDVHLKRPVAA